MQSFIVMETLPMAISIHLIYSLFGHSCFQKHKVYTAQKWLVPITNIHSNNIFAQV